MSENKVVNPTMQRCIVSPQDLDAVLKRLSNCKELVIDTETYGLDWANEDDFFMIQICDGEMSFLFNFKDYGPNVPILDKDGITKYLFDTILVSGKKIIGQNIGFDIHMLERCGRVATCELYDLGTNAKILDNRHGYGKYQLSDIAERGGFSKDDAVSNYIEEHELYSEVLHSVTGAKEKKPRYDLVPWEIMENYALTDVEVTWGLYEQQQKEYDRQESEQKISPKEAQKVESEVYPVLIAMERKGIRVDLKYCKEAYEHEKNQVEEVEKEFEKKYQTPFTDSVEGLGDVLKSYGVVLGKTPDGNPSIASWVLEDFGHLDIVGDILKHRGSLKKANTYFANLINFSDANGFIHPGFNPRGAEATGRMSGSRPNFQNVSKGETDLYPIRKAILPRVGNALAQLDFIAQELRLLFDYAREYEMAEQIIAGMDPHQKVADEVNVSRDNAKTLNFSIVYGIGKAKLGLKLGKTPDEAALFKARYLKKLPGVKDFIRSATQIAEQRGYVCTWDGARLYVTDKKKAYQAPNKIIQGGAAVMTKVWLAKCDQILKNCGSGKSHMLVPIHDACLFDLHPSDFGLIPAMIEAGRKSYPHKILPQDMSCDYGYESWHEMTKGIPGERDSI